MTLTPELETKLKSLEAELTKAGSLVIGFSGGVDSSLLVTVAHRVLGDKCLAVTIASAFCPQREVEEAVSIAKQWSIPHLVIPTNPLENQTVAANPPDRCYYCKKLVFSQLLTIAQDRGFAQVADGSNVDDRGDYRPGMRAIQKLKVISPLQAAGLTKADIRALSEALGLPTWKKESAACLASRIPYGEELTPDKLARVEAAETYLASLDLRHLRVRSHGDLARIEVAAEDFSKVLEANKAQQLTVKLKELGFAYVTLDLQGYRMGSLNETLKK